MEGLILKQSEVDALYDALAALTAALERLGVRCLVVAGSLLGAVRSRGILFCDDDIDVAILEEDYAKVLQSLPAALAPLGARFKRRPWPACDRVRLDRLPHVWVDLFVMRRFDSPQAVLDAVSRKDNGAAQPAAYVSRIAAALPPPAAFPLWHYDSRKAIELWPREFITEQELLPLRDLRFGELRVAAPARPLPYLRRAYGSGCLAQFVISSCHAAFSRHLADRMAQLDHRLDTPTLLTPAQYAPLRHSAAAAKDGADESALAALRDFVEAEHAAGRDRAGAKPAWFGAAVRRHTLDSPAALRFTPELLEVMEPHIAKARAARCAATAASPPASAAQQALQRMDATTYDAAAHALDAALRDALELPAQLQLERLHEHAPDKDALMARLRDAPARLRLQRVYVRFVLDAVCPWLATAAGCSALLVQRMPCVRVIYPSGFSLGPHCDAAYGHSPDTVNVVAPLTRDAAAAALVAESVAGSEDWQALPADAPGQMARFHGAQCLHFTAENATDRTRISLDARVLLPEARRRETPFDADDDYYVLVTLRDGEWRCSGEEDVAAWPPPDRRAGYPFR